MNFLHKIRQIKGLFNFQQSCFLLFYSAMLSFPPREVYVKPPQITLILASGPWGRGVMHLISPLGGKGLKGHLSSLNSQKSSGLIYCKT